MIRSLINFAILCAVCSSCAPLDGNLTFEPSTPPNTTGAGGQETNTPSGSGGTALHPTYSAGSTTYPPFGPGPDYY
jgi:hypothetical protein